MVFDYDSGKLAKLKCIIWNWKFDRKKQNQIMQSCRVNMKKWDGKIDNMQMGMWQLLLALCERN